MSKPESIQLWPGEIPGDVCKDFTPWLDLYPTTRGDGCGWSVVICPGGGYANRAAHEGVGYAEAFNERGIGAFVVQYRVAPCRHPAPLYDAARALRLVRQRATEFGVNPSKVAVCGSSAGGHLAASLALHHGRWMASAGDAADGQSARPDAQILAYPVISAGQFAHLGSFRQLLGDDPDPQLVELLSLEKQVTPAAPPAFLWHTVADQAVPVENSVGYARALRAAGVPFELHLYPEGRHGLGLALAEPTHVGTWFNLCCAWLEELPVS